MEHKLQSFSGHRTPKGEVEDPSILQEILPFLPEAFDDAVPLYVTMGLLFVVISRAARRRMKSQPYQPPTHEALVRASVAQSMGSNPQLGAYGGYWGDGDVKKIRD